MAHFKELIAHFRNHNLFLVLSIKAAAELFAYTVAFIAYMIRRDFVSQRWAVAFTSVVPYRLSTRVVEEFPQWLPVVDRGTEH